ncbi:hypothetical protein PT279_00850 [Bifidobacterium sp. ESL0784]|uniref:hypothetical protein n=1 Tax=Bifidobacterium sp. ESL0784 TaxID=2983231 RepID=UPI0023F7AA4D|nr:hypothetical protein [Bifidobacterium sp. ESL0784]MDF7640146.1 hypothetical protein [Bifidobacterium sp. ESL0784]
MQHGNRTRQEARPAASRQRKKQQTSLQTTATLLLAVLTMLLITACGSAPTAHTKQTDKSQPKTEKIVYPAQFVRTFGYYDDIKTPAAVAKSMEDTGQKYVTKAYADNNGDVVALVTERQRQANIQANNEWITKGERYFREGSPDYHYQINQDGTAMTVWTDKHLTPNPSIGIFTTVPGYSGYSYYLKGHAGPWDMTITVRNCHTDQQVGQFTATQGFTLDPATFGD